MNEVGFPFCPVCGHRLKKNNSALTICISCGFRYYVNPRPCNAVILHNGLCSEVLLVRRKLDPHKGMWDLPGGFISLNETAEESVVREIKEELGITLSHPLIYLGTFSDRYRYQQLNYHTLGIVYTSLLEKGAPLSCLDDVDAVRWFNVRTIPFDAVAFRSVKKALWLFLKKGTTR